MKQITLAFLLIFSSQKIIAQNLNSVITQAEVTRIETTLAADDMMGRKPFTPGIEKAALFIANEFKKNGLQIFNGNQNFIQQFNVVETKLNTIAAKINSTENIEKEKCIIITGQNKINLTSTTGFAVNTIKTDDNFFDKAYSATEIKQNTITLVSKAHLPKFKRLNRLAESPKTDDGFTHIFITTDATEITALQFNAALNVTQKKLQNVIGYLPGKTKPNEYVIFSGHYDHLGTTKPNNAKDSIYNGANDDAAGTTAVIALSKYFAQQKNNARSIIFVAFTAEETGGDGSTYFSQQLNPTDIVAMFNIEMIGTESKWGTNSAFITGYEKSNMSTILQKNLKNSSFKFEPDPYPEQQLFYRSDNKTLAALGVPAHTISTAKMDKEPFYHSVDDELETLNMANMTEIIKAIAISSTSIIAGVDTPTRIPKL
jgi:hypothetical protein